VNEIKMTNNGNRYNEEFKDDIIRFIQEEQHPLNKVAKDFGVNPQTIRNWMKSMERTQDPVISRVAELEVQ
jgi:transposase